MTEGGGEGEDSVVGELVLAWVRCYGDEALDENGRREDRGTYVHRWVRSLLSAWRRGSAGRFSVAVLALLG